MVAGDWQALERGGNGKLLHNETLLKVSVLQNEKVLEVGHTTV